MTSDKISEKDFHLDDLPDMISEAALQRGINPARALPNHWAGR